MVARGADAAGPVLLACRHRDPHGLARRLPCPGVGAWRSAPLRPSGVQYPVSVCAALAAGLAGSGRYLVLCLPRFLLPALRVPRCVLRAVPSGCPLPSLANTPFHAVCAFRELGLVALLVVPACPLRVCALALPRRPLPPPPGWCGLARSRHWALGGPLHVVRAPPRVLPRSLAPSGVLGGGRSGPGSSLPGLACTPSGGCVPRGWWAAVPGGGVACHCCEGRLVSGAVPSPTARPLGRAAEVPRPVCSGCGRRDRGDPAPAPQRAPLRAGGARWWGGGKASPGGSPSPVVRGV